MLRDQYIVASPELKSLYMKTIKYFQDQSITADILSKLNNLLTNPVIIKLITFIKNLNNLTFNHKILCLVINKTESLIYCLTLIILIYFYKRMIWLLSMVIVERIWL